MGGKTCLQNPHPGDMNLLISPVCPRGARHIGAGQGGTGVGGGSTTHRMDVIKYTYIMDIKDIIETVNVIDTI